MFSVYFQWISELIITRALTKEARASKGSDRGRKASSAFSENDFSVWDFFLSEFLYWEGLERGSKNSEIWW